MSGTWFLGRSHVEWIKINAVLRKARIANPRTLADRLGVTVPDEVVRLEEEAEREVLATRQRELEQEST